MKRTIIISLIILFALIATVIGHYFYLKSLAQADTYPADGFLQKQDNKKALIIVAHDDDAVSMSGTIAMLSKSGWEVRELCFYQAYKNKNPRRKIDIEKASKILGMTSVEYHDIELRKNLSGIKKPWLPIPYTEFPSAYNKDTAQYYIHGFIEKYKPSVIFTLDDVMGGYGHPDHVFVSKLVRQYCTQHINDSSFTVEAIYQAVFDPAMNEKILKDFVLTHFQLNS